MNLICYENLSQEIIHVLCYNWLDKINKQWWISRATGAKDILKILQNDVLSNVIILLPYPSWITNAFDGVTVFAVWGFLMEESGIVIAISNP